MHFLVYISAAAYLMGEEDLKDILEVSRKNNTVRNVTGLLLYHDGSFIQVLEGEKKLSQTSTTKYPSTIVMHTCSKCCRER